LEGVGGEKGMVYECCRQKPNYLIWGMAVRAVALNSTNAEKKKMRKRQRAEICRFKVMWALREQGKFGVKM